MAFVLVDAENARRSRWPNLSRRELLGRARAWAAREGHELLVVFDGPPPENADDVRGGREADDLIAELADQERGSPLWVVTSDRELRRRVGDRAARVLGGGSFLRDL